MNGQYWQPVPVKNEEKKRKKKIDQLRQNVSETYQSELAEHIIYK
jgi:hypothetical protein